MKAKTVCEKEIKIEGYDEELKELNIEDFNKIKFNSFLDENFIVFYERKEVKEAKKE